MAEEKSAGQVLQEHLDAMGPELGIIYNALRNEVAWVHAKWNQYQQLYARSPDRIALLNQVARHFFGVLQDVFLEDILLHLARLTDQPKVSGKDTLTLRRLPAVISGTQLKADVTNLLDTALNACKSIREWRNRRLAHRDLALVMAMPTDPLPGISRACSPPGEHPIRCYPCSRSNLLPMYPVRTLALLATAADRERLARVRRDDHLGWRRAACTFRLTAPAGWHGRVSATPDERRPSGPHGPGDGRPGTT